MYSTRKLTSNFLEEMSSSLQMDKETGVLSLTRAVAPGSYKFELTALYEEEDATARALGYLDVSSTGECEDNTTCFKFALVILDASEATANENLIPGSQPSDESCRFVKNFTLV
jgi:hypothetical protein